MKFKDPLVQVKILTLSLLSILALMIFIDRDKNEDPYRDYLNAQYEKQRQNYIIKERLKRNESTTNDYELPDSFNFNN